MATGIMFAVMIVLFWRSFVPGYVHFSNDGPLGAQMAEWLKMPAAFTGTWYDINTLGTSGGTFPVGISGLIRWALEPLAFSKLFVPISLTILGICSWCFFRQIGLTVALATVAALATALNSSFFSSACWGVGTQEICYGMIFLALALLASARRAPTALVHWTRVALAGMCVGLGIMEGADIGAMFSVLLAVYFLFDAFLNQDGKGLAPKLQSVARLALVVAMAAFLSAQAISSLVGFAIKGVAITENEDQSPEQKWSFATQWSLPKVETLSIAVPGLFGHRLDSPNGENYWGMVGSDLAWQKYFDEGQKSAPPQALARFTGNSFYAGILVLLVGMWAVFQSLRKLDSAFSMPERRRILFWVVIAGICLLLAWGRFSPFYAFAYHKVPIVSQFLSVSRNPTKFVFLVNFALVILFAYGLNGLWRRHVVAPGSGSRGLARWWQTLAGADRKWAIGCLGALALAIVAALLYTSSKPKLVEYLAVVGFPGSPGKSIAAFSIQQAWIFVALLMTAVGLLFFVLSGGFAGRRTQWFALVLGAFTVFDLGRAALPFIVPWNYKEKYDLNLKNPVVEFLRDRPFEHRMAMLPFPMPEQFELLGQIYRIEWAQHHFLYHNIQSLDVVQMSRMPADLMAYENAWSSRGTAGLLRRWELTNTRYLLGPAGFFDALNQQLDPAQKRFGVKLPFDLAYKPETERKLRSGELKREQIKLEHFTAVANPNGPYAVGEFRGALPRAKLYSNWIVNTNAAESLTNLFSVSFDPQRTVIVSDAEVKPATSTNDNAGTVTFTSYAPKHIVLQVEAKERAILLLNDRHDASWKVTVDGQPAALLRCNFLMRGVELPPGSHRVEFKFNPPLGALNITIAAMGVLVLLVGVLVATSLKSNGADA